MTADPVEVGRLIALDQLTAAPRTRAQLAATLQKRGVPDDAAQQVLDRLTDVGLVDDTAFANAWVTSRHAGRGLAPRALAHELRTRGVDDQVIAEAVGGIDAEELARTAQALVRRRAPATAGLDHRARMRRLAGMLARKGYPADLAMRAVRDALAEEVDDRRG